MTIEKRYEFKKELMQIHKPDLRDLRLQPNAQDFVFTDGTVVLLRNTIYRDSYDWGELEEGNALTHVVGVFLNGLEKLLNKTIWREHEHKKDLEHWFVLKYTAFKENATVIGRSLSFGLVLFCIGLCATLVYLLIVAFR